MLVNAVGAVKHVWILLFEIDVVGLCSEYILEDRYLISLDVYLRGIGVASGIGSSMQV